MLDKLSQRFSFTRRKKVPSIYAGYNDRMMSAAIDLFVALIMLRPAFEWLDTRISPHIQQAALDGGIDQVMQEAQHQPPGEQLSLIINAVFASDVWWWSLINHGSAFLLLASLLAVMQYTTGTTPGKWLMGLKLTGTDQVAPPSLWRLVIRYIACLPSCAVFMLGIVWTIFDKKRRSWHDIIAGTYVINLRPDGWYWNQVKRFYRYVRAQLGIPVSAPDEAVAKPATSERE